LHAQADLEMKVMCKKKFRDHYMRTFTVFRLYNLEKSGASHDALTSHLKSKKRRYACYRYGKPIFNIYLTDAEFEEHFQVIKFNAYSSPAT
jgi:hypothetical protein